MLEDVRQYQLSYSIDDKGKPVINETGVLVVTKDNIPHVDSDIVWKRDAAHVRGNVGHAGRCVAHAGDFRCDQRGQ